MWCSSYLLLHQILHIYFARPNPRKSELQLGESAILLKSFEVLLVQEVQCWASTAKVQHCRADRTFLRFCELVPAQKARVEQALYKVYKEVSLVQHRQE